MNGLVFRASGASGTAMDNSGGYHLLGVGHCGSGERMRRRGRTGLVYGIALDFYPKKYLDRSKVPNLLNGQQLNGSLPLARGMATA